MATNNQNTTPPAPVGMLPPTSAVPSNPINDLVSALGSVDPKAPDAIQNATSISDNNGGRIELNHDGLVPPKSKLIEK